MAWALVGAAAITTVGGAIAANSANKSAENAGNNANNLYQSNISRLTNFDQSQQQLYGPLEQNLVQQASSNQPMYYGQMSGQINAGVNAGERGLDTQMASRGMTGSGLQAGGIQGMEMGRQGTLANAFQTGLQMRTALGQTMLQRYQPMFTQQLMSGATTQAANAQTQQQMFYANAAQQGWNNVGKGLGSAVTAYGNMQGQPDTSTPDMSAGTNANMSNPQPGIPMASADNSMMPMISPGMTAEDYGSRFAPGSGAPMTSNLAPGGNYNSTLGFGGGQTPTNGLNVVPKFRVGGASTTGVSA